MAEVALPVRGRPDGSRQPFDAIVLAGGRGSRLGGVSKADLVVGGVRLLDRVLAATTGARTTVVVGPVSAPGVLVTREDPPGTGPAAGLVAGLAAITDPAPWTLVLACDLPGAGGGVPALHAAAASGSVQGYCLAGREGQPEWLAALYGSEALRAAASAYGDPRNRSVRGLVGSLRLAVVDPGDASADDLDTWADHARWNAHLRGRKRMNEPEDRTEWRPFIERATAAVGVEPSLVDADAILELTREIAHAGARPMAPVAAYILGLAVGAGRDPDLARRILEDAVSAAPLPQEEP